MKSSCADNTSIDIAIIGGGASGLAAAYAAVCAGARVAVFEKEKMPARKLLASGNGRCNLTNEKLSPSGYPGGTALAASLINRFDVSYIKKFFEDLGVLLITEPDGRVFPRTGRAASVAGALEHAAREKGAVMYAGARVTSVSRGSLFSISAEGQPTVKAKRLILACGSPAYPQLGATADGYTLARSLGHAITPVYPTLVPLCVKEKGLKRLSGLRADAELVPSCGGAARGELLFTDYGLSGPCAINASRALSRGAGETDCRINFFPEYDAGAFPAFLAARAAVFPDRRIKDFFIGLLPETLANLTLDFAGLPPKKTAGELTPSELTRISGLLTRWPVTVTGNRGWNEAMAASGGVNISEIDAATMASKKTNGLFITGELLDVDGITGGYNLHFAWASALSAGRAAAEGL